MFTAGAHLDGDDYLLVLGLSRQNIERLQQGQPIDISRESHGMVVPPHLRIMIFTGETEAEMAKQMAPLIGPDTVIDQKKPQ